MYTIFYSRRDAVRLLLANSIQKESPGTGSAQERTRPTSDSCHALLPHVGIDSNAHSLLHEAVYSKPGRASVFLRGSGYDNGGLGGGQDNVGE